MKPLQVILCKGLQASGKSTWAKNFVDSNPNFKRINRDSLRLMLDNGKWSQENEDFIVKTRNILIREALASGNSVIVDDTNFAPSNEAAIKNIAGEFGAVVSVREFNTDPKECILRDTERKESVGEKVILKTYQRWISKPFAPRPVVEGLPWCIICDVDNTLAIKKDRSPYTQRDVEYYEDDVNEPVAWAVKSLTANLIESQPISLVILSGRQSAFYAVTRKWIEEKAGIEDFTMFMRPTGDVRPDNIVKKELFQKFVENHFNVRVWIDDRLQVVRMVRDELGIPCWEVREGLF